MEVKCIKDTEGYWTEGESYPARHAGCGFLLVGDDSEPLGEDWSATPVEYLEDGTIIFKIFGIDGDVQFEDETLKTETNNDTR
ncbi:hypothetical protein KFO32_15740 [Pantoea ananatis]|uniref:hypothetical protein n=1 Tax=Pantoea ananas TaxID=553 RepID=UPI001FF19107|nr:hypothetical protein [Pantoea ananatis]MCK0554500.1 hypothetical protein [Pantoea ananatis]